MNERNPLLQIKLAANHQRRLRQEYLAELPEHLGTYLEKRPFIQSPELDKIVSMFYISQNGIVRDVTDTENLNFFKPKGYFYREFSWRHQLFSAVASVGGSRDEEMALLFPFSGPLYQVPFGWVREHIEELFTCQWHPREFGTGEKYCPESTGVITVDREAGLVLDNYCGYLDEDPNPDEVVYEFAAWGF